MIKEEIIAAQKLCLEMLLADIQRAHRIFQDKGICYVNVDRILEEFQFLCKLEKGE